MTNKWFDMVNQKLAKLHRIVSRMRKYVHIYLWFWIVLQQHVAKCINFISALFILVVAGFYFHFIRNYSPICINFNWLNTEPAHNAIYKICMCSARTHWARYTKCVFVCVLLFGTMNPYSISVQCTIVC